MERAHRYVVLNSLTDQAADALPHLPCRLVSESDGKHAMGAYVLLPYQVCDAVGDDTGLAGAGPREYEERAFRVCYGFALTRVEGFEDWGNGGHANWDDTK